MIEDEQTHTLPKSQDGLAHIACFAGFADVETFGEALRRRLETVQAHYAQLFEREAPLSAAKGNLVFTGVEDDPETIETLCQSGLQGSEPCRGRHPRLASRPHPRHAQRARPRTADQARARRCSTRFAATADPDVAFAQFDRFLSRLPARRAAFLALPRQSAIARSCGDDRGLGAQARRHHGARAGHARCVARSRFPGDAAVARRARPRAAPGLPDGARLRRRTRRRAAFRPRTDFPRRRAAHRRQGRKRRRRARPSPTSPKRSSQACSKSCTTNSH